MVTTERRSTDVLTPRKLRSRSAVLGVDGGGSKTHAVILDAEQRLIGEGVAGPSNPLRVGVSRAAMAVREAVDKACVMAQVRREDIRAAQIGLAGTRRKELSARVREALTSLGIRDLEVVSDAEIALYGATDGEPGVVVIAGTGSICCGMDARGKQFCAGGWGPLAGDEGGGAWISRRALRAIAHASDGRGPKTSLTATACTYFHVSTPEDLSTAIYAPSITNEHLAGFGKHVIEAALAKDPVAREIVAEAGQELGRAAAAVIQKLKLESERFQVAYVGRIFTAGGELVLEPMRQRIEQTAPRAFFAPPRVSPPMAAARMARERSNHVAVAV